MKIGLISDTHSYIDDAICKHFANCDEIWHAGDIGNRDVITKLEEIAPVIAVYGNIDSKDIRAEFPLNQYLEREGLHFFMTHIAGYPNTYNKRVKQILATQQPIDVLICGHSHILKVMKDETHQHLHINPGAAGRHGFHHMRTIIRFDVNNQKISNMEVVELGKRSAME